MNGDRLFGERFRTVIIKSSMQSAAIRQGRLEQRLRETKSDPANVAVQAAFYENNQCSTACGTGQSVTTEHMGSEECRETVGFEIK